MPLSRRIDIDKIEIVGPFRTLMVYTVTRVIDSVDNSVVGTSSIDAAECVCTDEAAATKAGVLQLAKDLWTVPVRTAYAKNVAAKAAAAAKATS